MNDSIKLVIITVLALLLAFGGGQLLTPSSSSLMQKYESLYQELSHKTEVSTTERQELERLFREINAEDNIKAELTETIIRYALFFALLVPTVIIGARYAKLNKDASLYAAGIIFVIFILAGAVIIGAIAGTLFFFVSQMAYRH